MAWHYISATGAPKLMLIHGRSPDRDSLKSHLIEKLGVREVVVLVDKFEPMEAIPYSFERYAASVDGAIALVTPDDFGALAEQKQTGEPRARQNVWIEVGWFWGRRGRSKRRRRKPFRATIKKSYVPRR